MNFKYHKLLFLFIISFGLCSSDELEQSFVKTESVHQCFNETDSINESMVKIDEISKVMLDGSQHFAFRLFKSLNSFSSVSDDIIYSPISIWSTLVVAYLASSGETETELRNKLKLQGYPKSSIALAYKGIRMWFNLKNNMSSSSQKTIVTDLNKLFIEKSLKVNDCFYDIFSDEIEKKNFKDNSVRSLMEINEWVANNTNGHIKNLLSSGSVTPQTKVLIANAVYFKSVWAQQFDASNTKKDKFYVTPTETIDVDMMSIDYSNLLFGISEDLQATAVDIPYSNPDYSMLIILPHENKHLDSLIKDISLSKYQDLINNLIDEEVRLVLPKFKAEKEFELAGPLYSMGIMKLFDPRYVNMTYLLPPTESGIALDSVVHKAYIKVNEEGTEAAAATALIYARSGRPAFPALFIANRPFLYIIRNLSTNTILFLGTVKKPRFE